VGDKRIPGGLFSRGFVGKFTFNIGSDEYGGKWEAVNAAGEAVS